MKNNYKNVLLMDDNEADQFIARKLMQVTGFAKEVAISNTKQSALDFLSDARTNHKNLPDFIFLDINRPALEGFSFLSDFEKLPSEIKNSCKIIILSSTDNRYDMNNVFKSAYVEKIVTKPLTAESITKLLL